MSFNDSIKQAIEIVKLNGKVAENVSKDKNATLMGILIIAIGSILSAIIGIYTGLIKITSLLIVPIFGIIFFIISVGLLHILARLFGGKAKFMEYFSKSFVCWFRDSRNNKIKIRIATTIPIKARLLLTWDWPEDLFEADLKTKLPWKVQKVIGLVERGWTILQ